jgi:hypothetical protein
MPTLNPGDYASSETPHIGEARGDELFGTEQASHSTVANSDDWNHRI